MTTTDAIRALRTSHGRLHDAVAPLTPEQLRSKAYPAEWSIAQVLSHLGSGAEINHLVLDAGATGSAPPERGVYQGIWDTWNAKSPEQQVADGLAADARLTARYEELAQPEHAALRFQTWAGEVDLNGVAMGRLSEHTLHTWDVVIAVEPGATLAPDAVPIVLAQLGRLVGWALKPAGRTGRIRVTTTDPAGDQVLNLGEQSTMEEWSGGDSIAHVTLPAEAFIRLVYGRLDPANTPEVRVDGLTLDELRAMFPGV